MTSFCDYLTATVPFPFTEEISPQSYFMEKFPEIGTPERNGSGLHGYQEGIWFSSKTVFSWTPSKRENRFFIGFPSEALGYLHEFHKVTASDLVERFIKLDAKFTRFDLANDDFLGLLQMDRIYQKIESGEIASRLRTWREYRGHIENSEIRSHKIGKSESIGRTIYLGDLKNGNVIFRFYDKAAEQGIDGHWVRCELQLRGEAADQFCNPTKYEKTQTGRIKVKKETTFKDRNPERVFLYYLRFLEKTFTNKTKVFSAPIENGFSCFFDLKPQEKKRWVTSKWWLDFLGTNEKEKIGMPKYKTEIEDLFKYWEKSLSGLHAVLYKADPDRLDQILYELGSSRLMRNTRYKNILDKYRKKKNEDNKQKDFLSL